MMMIYYQFARELLPLVSIRYDGKFLPSSNRPTTKQQSESQSEEKLISRRKNMIYKAFYSLLERQTEMDLPVRDSDVSKFINFQRLRFLGCKSVGRRWLFVTRL